jgi:oxygen-independent coproporphyrinogen-3 oxidase
MAGIYIHIPYCRQKCHYCNFHFSTSLKSKNDMLLAIQRELVLAKDYLHGASIETVYLGGGTPSLLSPQEIQSIWHAITENFPVTQLLEFTIETNPDDLNSEYLALLRELTPVNRLSIGIQSFRDEDLQYMNRAHNAAQAIKCIQLARESGFDNLTVDLIYGIPGLSNEAWKANLEGETI